MLFMLNCSSELVCGLPVFLGFCLSLEELGWEVCSKESGQFRVRST